MSIRPISPTPSRTPRSVLQCTVTYNLMMTSMRASEARAALPELLSRVEDGEEVTITRHGRPVAVLVRPDALRVRRAEAALDEAARIHNLLAGPPLLPARRPGADRAARRGADRRDPGQPRRPVMDLRRGRAHLRRCPGHPLGHRWPPCSETLGPVELAGAGSVLLLPEVLGEAAP